MFLIQPYLYIYVSYSTMVRKERQTEKGGEEEKLFLGAI
jgi:hypothetical protein